MDWKKRAQLLQRRCDGLAGEKAFALKALRQAAALGHFESSYARQENPEAILAQTAARAREMLPFRATAIYLADGEAQRFEPAYRDNAPQSQTLEAEVERLVADHSFATALKASAPSFYPAASGAGDLFLLPLKTQTGTRGMFAGLLDAPQSEVSDITLALLAIVMNACAHALENMALNARFKDILSGLEKTVEDRTREAREAYEQVRLILDSVQAGVIVIDARSMEILDANAAACGLLGRARNELAGRLCHDCACLAGLTGPMPQNSLNEERVLTHKDGREIPVLASAVKTRLGPREVIVESFVDITEQRKLNRLREDVERITRHDLKAPLSGIISLPDLLLDNEACSAEDRDILALIKESGLKMLTMINFSLDLFKMETGTYRIHAVPVDVTAVLGQVIGDLRDLISGKAVLVETALDGAPLEKRPFILPGEELLFFSLFSNLVKNAVEASPQAGIVRIELTSGDPAQIRIHNQGNVPDDMMDRFFDKYATSGKESGTGLGTYSAKLIVQYLKGEIGFTSTSLGVCVWMRLPSASLPQDQA